MSDDIASTQKEMIGIICFLIFHFLLDRVELHWMILQIDRRIAQSVVCVRHQKRWIQDIKAKKLNVNPRDYKKRPLKIDSVDAR